MKDLAIALDNRPGALAEMGEALGKAGVSVEGGGASSPVAYSTRIGTRMRRVCGAVVVLTSRRIVPWLGGVYSKS
jgi:hypothetical protein